MIRPSNTARRLKSPARSRRSIFFSRNRLEVQPPSGPPDPGELPLHPGDGASPDELPGGSPADDDQPVWDESTQELAAAVAAPSRTSGGQAIPPASVSSHTPTGWDWFAQWSFPSQLFLFASVLAAGMWWIDHGDEPRSTASSDPAPVIRPAPKPRPQVRPETFDWLNRLRETQVVTSQLEAEFSEAQEFYREYALDEFLDFDPWSLGSDEVLALTHFCDHGFFTVEREILVKILERRALEAPPAATVPPRGALARLEAAARDRESRLASLREAAELYRRGRVADVQIPAAVGPEEDQAQRARLVDKLARVRRERDRLDARIGELNGMLR